MKALSAWLSPAWNEVLELRGDLDQIEALTIEREALWARLQGVSFLTDDEKRAAIGYGPMPASPMEMPAAAELMEQDPGPFDDATVPASDEKFDPNQPRHPAGSSDGGRWSVGGGGGLVHPAGGRGGSRGGSGRGPLKQLYDFFSKKAGVRRLESSTQTPGDILSQAGSLKGELKSVTQDEKEMLDELVALGNDVEVLRPKSEQGSAGRTNDWKVNGVDFEYKVSNTKASDSSTISRAIAQQINDGSGQSENILWRFGRGWLRRVETTLELARSIAATIASSDNRKGDLAMTEITTPVETPVTDSKWWGSSLTIWGAITTGLAAVLPVLGPLLGLELTTDLITTLGQQTVAAVQALVALVGTLMTIAGRARATQVIERRAFNVRL